MKKILKALLLSSLLAPQAVFSSAETKLDNPPIATTRCPEGADVLVALQAQGLITTGQMEAAVGQVIEVGGKELTIEAGCKLDEDRGTPTIMTLAGIQMGCYIYNFQDAHEWIGAIYFKELMGG